MAVPRWNATRSSRSRQKLRKLNPHIAWAIFIAVLVWSPRGANAQPPSKHASRPTRLTHRVQSAAIPFTENRVHRIGNLWLNVTNYGVIAGVAGGLSDPCTGMLAPALEFPGGTGTVNLWDGSIWIGAVKGRDTLVSVGAAIWPLTQSELFPASFPGGQIEERTTRQHLKAPKGSRCATIEFHEDAVSEHDVIAVYYDTLRSAQFVNNDPNDGRGHVPLGIEITQKSYSWSLSYAQDFILIDYTIRNIGGEHLKEGFIGIYMDQDLYRMGGDGWLDDIAGFLRTDPTEIAEESQIPVNTAWAADNDGDPTGGEYGFGSNPTVSGIRIIRKPATDAFVSFNWFVGNDNQSVDWGPVRRSSRVQFLRSGLGAPHGDVAKYQMMSNGEIDYDQMESAISHEFDGWLPPTSPAIATNIADGWDIRYLLSTGPFDLPAESSVTLTVAIVAGDHFHSEPAAFTTYWDARDPGPYVEHLDFSDFALNSRWADWVFDTPGFDTDGDGYRGEFHIVNGEPQYYRGDGVPDYSGPPAPPAPGDLRFVTAPGKLAVRWNGRRTETARDPFSNLEDFEGYRVYMSRTGLASDFMLLAQRDRINYTRYRWNANLARWQTPDPPFSLDSLKILFDELTDSVYSRPFHPNDFMVADIDQALRDIRFDPLDPILVDTSYYYFGPFDANLTVDDVALADLAREGVEILSSIRRLYPNAPPDSLAFRDDGTEYAPYYEYEYAIKGLQTAEPVFFAVTAFDFGLPSVGLDRLETSPLINVEEVWPIISAEAIGRQNTKPGVYPNPYSLADHYNLSGWEDPRRAGLDPERARRVTFTSVPETCVVSIYSLDGDLVRRLDHRAHPSSSDATVVVWNLISRNTQAVKSGIYIWTVESRFETHVGKLVIIK